MNKLTWFVVAVLVLVGGWLLLNNQTSQPTETGPIKIGVIGPFTGDAAVYGEPMQKTLQLAFDEINAAGGINGRQVEPIFEDGKCDGNPAVSAAQKLVNVDGVQAIIGGFCSGETIPSVPVAEAGKVVLFSPSASSPALTGISPFFFRNYPSDSKQGEVLADVANKKGYKNIAFITEQTDYATGLYSSFKASFEALGGETTSEEFQTSNTDFRSTVTKIKAQKPDAVFLSTQTPQAAERIMKQMTELGYKPQLFVSDVTMGEQELLMKNKDLLEGAIGAEFVPDQNNAKLKALKEAYKSTFDKDMPYVGYMSTVYDALYTLVDGMKAVGNNGEKLAAWSRTISNWQGASGSTTIGPDGDRVSGHKAEIVKDGKVEPLSL
jgi:branched-chain amino acid transport system substrate-binding protein